jgi:serine/threonine protein kinase
MSTLQLYDVFKDNKSIIEELLDHSSRQDCSLQFGKYLVTCYLGQGSFARVFQAVDTQRERNVALKVIDLSELQSKYQGGELGPKMWNYLKDEENNMRKCKSAYILKLYESYSNEKCKVLVLEYCNGGTLEEYIKKRGGLA